MRSGLGKLRHMSTNQLWVQEKVRSGEVEIHKVTTRENIADTLTKYVNRDSIGKHMRGTASRLEEGRHEMMPEYDDQDEEEPEGESAHDSGEDGDQESQEEEEPVEVAPATASGSYAEPR